MPTHSERDLFVSETKHSCRVNDAFDATALLVERIYDGNFPLWYGRLVITCGEEEFRQLKAVTCLSEGGKPDLVDVVKIDFEDGRFGPARIVCGRFYSAVMGPEAGDYCECYFVGVEVLQKPPAPPQP
jgi:hypothetical protein